MPHALTSTASDQPFHSHLTRMASGVAVAGLSLCLAITPARALQQAHGGPEGDLEAVQAGRHWVEAWASAQMVPDAKAALPAADTHDVTLRQTVRVSLAGKRIRLRLSNAMGTTPLRLNAVTVALSVSSGRADIQLDSLKDVRVHNQGRITIPPGAEYLSDPIPLEVSAGTDLTISLYQAETPDIQTSHPGSRATTFVIHGDHSHDQSLSGYGTLTHWYELSGVSVEAPEAVGAVAVLGDSITDGFGVQPDTNLRWTDFLVQSLSQKKLALGVLNLGIGGNRLLLDGLGPNAISRLERDILSKPGLTSVIVLEGVNDLGSATRESPISPQAHDQLVADVIAAYAQIVTRAHARGLKVIGATITPYGGNDYYHPDTRNEADRQAINDWIRTPGHFDAVIDFDARLRDPADPQKLKAEYDSGDHLHPTPGYGAMGQAVDPAILASPAQKGRSAGSGPPRGR